MTIETILVGVDFSPEAEVAIAHAIRVASHVGARVVFLHAGVMPDRPVGVPESMAPTMDAFRAELDRRLHDDRQRLESLRERYTGQGAEIANMVIEGFPDTALRDAAGELGADLVVVGTHGQTGIKRFLLGSVAERVVRICDQPVMVARPGPTVSRRILVPTDFSPGARDVVRYAISLAGPGARIDLLYCWHLPIMTSSYYAPSTADDVVIDPIRTNILDTARDHAEGIISSVEAPADIELSYDAVEAPPAYGIHERAESGGYDLIVMGSHGRRGMRRWLLGSVAEVTVRHAPCSVLVVHRPREAE